MTQAIARRSGQGAGRSRRSPRRGGLVVGALGLLLGACGAPGPDLPSLMVRSEDPTDAPLRAATAAEHQRFLVGDAAFDVVFRDADGLGPAYVRASCGSCHEAAAKGPGGVQKMVLLENDGVTIAADQSPLTFGHTVRPYVAGGASTPLLPPESGALAGRLKLSTRAGVPVFGRGYIEAVADSEIERVAAEQARRGDGITGRVSRVVYASEANPDQRYHQHKKGDAGLIGRFGLKARIVTLDDFAADAAQGDMSITSPLRPAELPNPDGLTDDRRPGVDVSADTINELADYMRLIEIPRREAPSQRGVELFAEAQCAACHVPSLRTRADYPIAALAGIDAPVFTDLLLHDMGDELADGLAEGGATARQWRTAPLIGLRHLRGLLHDGRAKTVEDAVLKHDGRGSEAAGSVARFRALPDADRAELLRYVGSL